VSPRFLDVDLDVDTLTRDPVTIGHQIVDAFGALAAAPASDTGAR
jgi:hypothetical protein